MRPKGRTVSPQVQGNQDHKNNQTLPKRTRFLRMVRIKQGSMTNLKNKSNGKHRREEVGTMCN